MKIVLDRDTCIGSGMCESLAPEYFEVHADGELEVLRADVAAADRQDVEEAVAACPTGALSIEP